MSNLDEKVVLFQQFINNKLKKDLLEIETLLKTKVTDYNNWQDLTHFIGHIENCKAKEFEELLTTFHLGSNTYISAKVEDFEKIIVNIGCNCYLEMYYNEAVKYIDLRLKYLKKEINFVRQQAAYIKAHIKFVLLAISEIQNN